MATMIFSTVGSEEEARKIGRTLIEKKVVACVNIIPKITSIYRWNKQIQQDTESLIIAKTTDKNSEKTIEIIKSLHSYEIPEIIMIPIAKGLETYLEWIESETI